MSVDEGRSGSKHRRETTGLRGRGPWTAAVLSALLPGTGQLYAGHLSTALWLIAVDFVLVGLLYITGAQYGLTLVKLWATTDGLVAITAGSLVLLGYRVWASRNALTLVRGDTSTHRLVGLSAVVVVLAIPHLFLGYLSWIQYSVVTEVFADEPVAVVTSSTTEQQESPEPEPAVDEPKLWDGVNRLNLLFLGADVGAGRSGIRTDTMIVLSLEPATGQTLLVSIPRNLSGIELPQGVGVWDCNCFPRLLNELYAAAEDNPEAFPGTGEAGPLAMKTAIGNLLDLEIHYYAMVTLDGFVGIVDALGGVDIDVPNTIIDETYPHEDGVTIEHVVIEEGHQHLDGHLALAYARIRRHADDFARMNRQRCILGAVLEQSNPIELVANYGAIAEVLKQSLSTDIPRDRLPDFIDLLPVLDTEKSAILHIDRDYISGTGEGRTYYDQDRIRAETHALLTDPGASTDGLDLESTCG